MAPVLPVLPTEYRPLEVKLVVRSHSEGRVLAACVKIASNANRSIDDRSLIFNLFIHFGTEHSQTFTHALLFHYLCSSRRTFFPAGLSKYQSVTDNCTILDICFTFLLGIICLFLGFFFLRPICGSTFGASFVKLYLG